MTTSPTAGSMARSIRIRDAGGTAALRVDSVPDDALGKGDVRVAVGAVGINFRDVKHTDELPTGADLPFVPGSDFAGEIVEVAPDVDANLVGTRVLGVVPNGAYAERVVVPVAFTIPIDDDVAYEVAAVTPVSGLSASFLVDSARIAEGQTVVTYAAAGGLGSFLGGLLKVRGARTIGLTSTVEKAEIAHSSGHDNVVNYRDTDAVEAVRELTDGNGADVVFDSVGGAGFTRSFQMLKNEGTVVLCGRSAGEPDLAHAQTELIDARRNLALREFYLNTYIIDHFAEIPDRISELLELQLAGAIRVPITRYSFADVAEAHAALRAGTTSGKLVLMP
jgi:NADPH2:quinone reductase